MLLKLQINKPWWDGEKVGIAARRLVPGTTMEVEILYEDAHNQRVYPYKYRMGCSKIKTYPTHNAKGTVLHIVPIADFDVIGEEDDTAGKA